jgi:DUF1365 family protein
VTVTVAVDRAPYLYDVQVNHVRTTPIHNAFRYRSYLWLVDLDALPELPRYLRPFARFTSRDHCGDPGRTLRQNVDAYLGEHGIDLHGGAVRMLANARVLGYVFNPLTAYWCHTGAGELACVIAEVHNTYHRRHRYLLFPDSRGRAQSAKEFYVSPFNAAAGHYTMSLPEPGETLQLNITLHPPNGAPFVASVSGDRCPARGRSMMRLLLGRPYPTLLISLRIRWQGIRLYLRGLPVVPRRTESRPDCEQEHA